MGNFLGRYTIYIYAILRMVSGFLFMWHGTQKLLGFPPSQRPGGTLDALSAVGGGIELLGGLLIMVGLFTSIAAFIASGTMAVAYFGWHFAVDKFLPIQNGGELAALYSFVFLYIAARGSGVWSVESLFKGSRPAAADLG
jgi:putative oxidoreductase